MDITFIGNFKTVTDIWQQYPYGGIEGDYCSVDGVKYRWDKFKRQWVSTGESFTGDDDNPIHTETPVEEDPSKDPLPPIVQTGYRGSVDLNYIGSFRDKAELYDKYPYGGIEGDYCSIDGIKHRWDKRGKKWVSTGEELDAPLSVVPAEPEPTDVSIAEAKDLRYLGAFEKLIDVWEKYPYGGIEGDYVRVADRKLHWNKYTRQWGDYQEFIEQLKQNRVINDDLTINGTLTVQNIILGGNLISYGSLIGEIEKAKTDAQEAAKEYANAVALSESEKAKIYADGIVAEEEAQRLSQIEKYLLLAKRYADDTSKALETRLLAMADGQVSALEKSQIDLINAQSELVRVKMEAMKDGIITEAEKIAIREAEQRVNAAKEALEKEIANVREQHADAVLQMANVIKELENVKKQLDGKINHYKGDYIPTNDNAPANEWTTDEQKANHLYDVFVDARQRDKDDPTVGRVWQYQGNESGGYTWEVVEDPAIDEVWRRIGEIDGSLDGKSTVFLTQPTKYERGDMWILQEDFGVYKKGTILIANADSGEFVAGHWQNMLVYITDQEVKDAISVLKQDTERRFQDAKETMDMLKDSLQSYTEGISPITVHTMQMLIGDESLQYRFVEQEAEPIKVVPAPPVNITKEGIVTIGGATIQHMTIGISSATVSREIKDYRFWQVAPLSNIDPIAVEKGYYIYIRASKMSKQATWVVSDKAIGIDEVIGYYSLLYGIVNRPKADGSRSFIPMNGFTEITPGRLTIGRMQSPDGQSWIDWAKGALHFQAAPDSFLDINTLGDGKVRIKGGLMTVGDSDTTIEEAIQAQKDATDAEIRAREEADQAETKAREALDRDRPAVWSIEVYDTEHPLSPPLLEDKLEGYRTSVTYAYRVLRSGVDVTEVIAKSPAPLVRWARRNPKGYDDDGLADREWEAAHATERTVTLTTRHIHFECAVTATADSTSLEEYYKSL